MHKIIQSILKQLTLDEKAGLCSGESTWLLKSIERLGLSTVMVTDGPHGLRKQAGEADHLGINQSVPATCFPTASATASSWDVVLMKEMGKALGEECLTEQVSVLLGPGVNIKRSPLCGRNFEYISEDPYHTGEMAAALINGIQSKGVGTSLKHFAANNQEQRRMTIDTLVDERTLREIYLAGFETAVKKAQPWTVMCAYNQLNGTYCCEHKMLLTTILKEEWGHKGVVITDWGAMNNRVEAIRAGLELEMPGSNGINDRKIVKAVQSGELSEEVLDQAVIRIIELILKAQVNRKDDAVYDVQAHHSLARKIAGQCMVLLKNEDCFLPLKYEKKVAVIGTFAKHMRYQGSGSSQIHPTQRACAYDAFVESGITFAYAPGYDVATDEVDEKLIQEACKIASQNEKVIIYGGLTEHYESEGYDRDHMQLPANQNALIQAIAKVNPNVVVVLHGGSPVEMPWLDDVKAVLNAYLCGQASGQATLDILYGDINPSGKLAETYPVKLEDSPSYAYFPGGTKSVQYRESIYVGYRYYDTAYKPVLFPFGHGLSYTTFEYSNLQLQYNAMQEDESVKVSVQVKNTGRVSGAEVVQLYVSPPKSTLYKAKKELKGFSKVFLQPQEEKTVTFILDRRAFAYYNVMIKDWHVETGAYKIKVGSSSRDIRLESTLEVVSLHPEVEVPDYRAIAPVYYNLQVKPLDVSNRAFESIYGGPIRSLDNDENEVYTLNTPVGELMKTKTGGAFLGELQRKMLPKEVVEGDTIAHMMMRMASEMPLRSLMLFTGGQISEEELLRLLEIMNDERKQ